MSSPALKELLETALDGEPDRSLSADRVIARGRARRARRLRRRAGGGVLVAAAVVAGLALPESPVSVIDGEAANGPRTGGARAEVAVAPEVADDPLKLAMWEAIDDALPGDVRLVEGSYVSGASPGPNIYLSLERSDVTFTTSVWMQNSRPDLPDYRPCSEPEPLIGPASLWTNCEEGADDDGRWRVIGDQGQDRFLVVEGGSAAVTMRWGVHYAAAEVDEEGRALETKVALTDAEADAVADAVWAVGARHPAGELVSGIDLEATADGAWPDVEAALEEAFGPLTVTEPVGGEVNRSVDGLDTHTGMVTAGYETADGVQVEVAVWQRDRLYQPLCVETYGECHTFPGGVHTFGDGDGDPVQGHAATGAAGQRGALRVQIDSADPALEDAVSRANVEALQAVPFLGDEPHPLPAEM